MRADGCTVPPPAYVGVSALGRVDDGWIEVVASGKYRLLVARPRQLASVVGAMVERLRRLALRLPGAASQVAAGRTTTFKVPPP